MYDFGINFCIVRICKRSSHTYTSQVNVLRKTCKVHRCIIARRKNLKIGLIDNPKTFFVFACNLNETEIIKFYALI